MKSRSLTFRILRSIGIVIVIFIASVFIINLSIFDEELKPEVLSLLEPVDNTLAQGNAYIAFWGITSNSSQDYYDSGLELMKQYRKIKLEDHQAELSKVDLEKILGPDHLDKDWLDKYEGCRALAQYGCLEKISQFIKLNPVKNQRLLFMQERFVQILKMRNYQHIIMEINEATPLPRYGLVMRLSQIKLSEAYNTQDKINFIMQLREDLQFWRMVLEQSNTLVDKMVALASIWNDYQYLSEYLLINTLNEQEKNSADNLLKNLSSSELSMQWALESDARILLKGIHRMDSELDMSEHFDVNSGITNNLWQKNATLNQTYENTFLPLACLSKLSGADFYSYIVEGNTSNCGALENSDMGFSLSNLYNPGGKILASIAVPAYSDYIARIHDLNGIISLVKLQFSLKLSANQQIEDAIKNSAIRNPYTGEPMDYDQKEGWLSFECLDRSPSCRIKL